MKVSDGEDVASHTGPESWLGACECAGQALTGEYAGWVLSREIVESGVPTPSHCAEGHIGRVANERLCVITQGKSPVR